MDPGRSDRHQSAIIHRSGDYGKVQLPKTARIALWLPIAATMPVASVEIGNRPTAVHVRRNTKFELCENSASSAAAAAQGPRPSFYCCARCAALNVDSNGRSAGSALWEICVECFFGRKGAKLVIQRGLSELFQ
jgi:hypothetical protein